MRHFEKGTDDKVFADSMAGAKWKKDFADRSQWYDRCGNLLSGSRV